MLGVLSVVAPLLLGGVLFVRWWRNPPAPAKAPGVDTAPLLTHREERLDAFLARGLAAGIERARCELGIGTIGPGALARTVETVKRAVSAGTAASLLVRDGDATVYIVALPVRAPQPQAVRRYLGSTWPEHVQEVQELAESGATTLIVLCSPAAVEATLLVGRIGGEHGSDPDVLLGAREARAGGANSFQHIISLTV